MGMWLHGLKVAARARVWAAGVGEGWVRVSAMGSAAWLYRYIWIWVSGVGVWRMVGRRRKEKI